MTALSDTEQFLFNRYPSHILFQLILTGFLHTQECVKALKMITTKITTVAKPQQHHDKMSIIHAIENLIGPSSPFRSPFPWNITNSILTKLKDDCSLFQTIYKNEFTEATAIKKQADKSWLYSSELRELATHLSTEEVLENNKVFNRFQKVEALMIRALKSLGNAIVKTFKYFKTNENVLYYLLCHQPTLDSIYGHSFTVKTFRQMYKNLEKAQDFLVEAYRKRGFEKLIPIITQKMSSLQYTVCQ